ncbi:MAG: hypothetical protein BWY15_02011 [Firmicutes bacterium ADurb.Bin193]|nr:MAG: hypothetical protein BWY15_02011 [Firmicutes bacterium ADurb.Bin193]
MKRSPNKFLIRLVLPYAENTKPSPGFISVLCAKDIAIIIPSGALRLSGTNNFNSGTLLYEEVLDGFIGFSLSRKSISSTNAVASLFERAPSNIFLSTVSPSYGSAGAGNRFMSLNRSAQTKCNAVNNHNSASFLDFTAFSIMPCSFHASSLNTQYAMTAKSLME